MAGVARAREAGARYVAGSVGPLGVRLAPYGRVPKPEAQEAFAEDMGYNPSVTVAKIPPETEKRIGFNADERKRLIDLDYAYLAKNDAALKEWWDKTLKG